MLALIHTKEGETMKTYELNLTFDSAQERDAWLDTHTEDRIFYNGNCILSIQNEQNAGSDKVTLLSITTF